MRRQSQARKCASARLLSTSCKRSSITQLRPSHRCEEHQRHLLQINLRDTLVLQRVNMITRVRFILKSLCLRLASPGTSTIAKYAREHLKEKEAGVLDIIEPTLKVLDTLNAQICELDHQIEPLCEESYPNTQRLRQIPGVDPITSLAFVRIVGDPTRFKHARDVGPYLSLVPKRDQSGTLDKQLAISKTGVPYFAHPAGRSLAIQFCLHSVSRRIKELEK